MSKSTPRLVRQKKTSDRLLSGEKRSLKKNNKGGGGELFASKRGKEGGRKSVVILHCGGGRKRGPSVEDSHGRGASIKRKEEEGGCYPCLSERKKSQRGKGQKKEKGEKKILFSNFACGRKESTRKDKACTT